MPILMHSALRRKRLLNFLRHLIAEQSISPQQVKQLEPLLNEAVESLIALEYGEAQPIFAPARKKKSWYGTKPYTLRKLQMMALGFADLLIKKKYKGEHAAIRTVAQAFGIKADRLRGWRKNEGLGKTTDPSMKSFREKIAQLDWSLCRFLLQAGYDPGRPLHAYRGDVLSLRVRTIGEGARLTVKTAGNGQPVFAPAEGAAAPPIQKYNRPLGAVVQVLPVD